MSVHNRIFPALGLLALSAVGAPGAHADDAACKPVLDAMIRYVTTPNHLAIEKGKANGRNLHCRSVRDEPVAGEAAALYTVHSDTDGSTSDEQTWISRRSGQPLKLELDVRLGGDGGTGHLSSAMAYAIVRAPDGVQH